MRYVLAAFAALSLIHGCSNAPMTSFDQPYMEVAEFDMRRCLNMGNALDSPRGAPWGPAIDTADFKRLRRAGFDTIRLPVRFNDYTGPRPAYEIDPDFLAEVTGIIDAALAADLNVILDLHHFYDMFKEPRWAMPQFLAIWRQLAAVYADYPEDLWFEILNEPQGVLKGEPLLEMQKKAVQTIRAADPDRIIILGGENWSDANSLLTNIPPPDANIVYTVHFYEPFNFTHQGAAWLGKRAPRTGRDWGDESERQSLSDRFEAMAADRTRLGRPVFLGEFGVAGVPETSETLKWVRAARVAAETQDMPWCLWMHIDDLRTVEDGAVKWDEDMLEALGLPERPQSVVERLLSAARRASGSP